MNNNSGYNKFFSRNNIHSVVKITCDKNKIKKIFPESYLGKYLYDITMFDVS